MTNAEPVSVLVVDDEPDVADAYAAQLEGDFDVTTAYSGREALDSIDASVDVVLLDRRMPGISGDEVLEHIRDRGFDSRVAMVTAVDPDFDIIDMPFDDYITKPVSREDLYETIERLQKVSEYDKHLQEYFSLTAKQAALRTNKTEAALQNNERYADLEAEIQSTGAALDEAVSEFDDEDFEAAFRDLDPGVQAGHNDE